MPELVAALRPHARVGLDSQIFIYWFEDVGNYVDLAGTALTAVESGSIDGVTSTLTLMELVVRPLQLGRFDLVTEYEFRFRGFPNLSIVDVGIDTARRAAELRARHRLNPVDAVQIAACLQRDATAFVTNDRRLRRVTEIDVLILDDFLSVGSALTTP